MKQHSLKKIAAFLGLEKNMAALLTMVILVGMGEKMAERFLPLYLLALGGGVLSVGFLNGMDNLLSALYSFPGGYFSDKLGAKRALILFNIIAMLGFLIVIIFPYWQAVIIGSIFFLSWTAISLPATMSLVSKVLPQNKHTMGVSVHSFVRRIPMALGPVIGGVLISRYGETLGVRIAFVVAFIFGGVSLLLQQMLIENNAPSKINLERNPFKMFPLMTPALNNLLISDILIRFCEQIPYAFVVIWCIKNVGITPVQFGILSAIEMATAMFIYIPIAYLADKNAKKPFIIITFVFFTIFPIFLLFSRSFLLLILAFIIRGLKEFGEPTRKTLIMQLAPEDKKASVFGLYYLLRDCIVSIAAFGGAFLWNISPATNFIWASICGLIGTLYFVIRGKDFKIN